ncbi:MAG: CoA-acylating methylmalonate-semialdehyde dehydrogenase [Actinomycetota bacterium]|nr:CoA-acylating methylmalonate-semialdehyde dehydrogenase [Actinomycetota bacterium]
MYDVGHFINGKEVDGRSNRFGEVFQPSTGQLVGRVSLASDSEVDSAVEVAKAAANRWRDASLSARVAVMERFRELLEKGADELAEIISRENGKLFLDAKGEVLRGMESVEFACGAPVHLQGAFSELIGSDIDAYSLRQSVGVVAAITPANFPAMVPLWMIPNALVCGNAVIFKPSEKDPSAGMWLANRFTDAGLPDGVLNVVNGDSEAVKALLAHPGVDAVSFVGSTPVARAIYEMASIGGKRVQALGGAKNHLMVLPDADLSLAADAAISAGYGAAGQRCMAISVVLPVGGVANELVQEIELRAKKVVVGDSMDPSAQLGPLITKQHRDRVAGYVAAAESTGAEVVVDGSDQMNRSGFFLGPCLVDKVSSGMATYRDEIFGPVLSVVRSKDYSEAIDLVNANPFGNGAALFTSSGKAARAFQRDARIGMLGINVPVPVPPAHFSFGGWKGSLFGDLHMYGPDGIKFFSRGKTVMTRW